MFFYSLLKSGADFGELLICVLAMLIAASFAIVFHEVAHGYAALLSGDSTAKVRGRLSLNPIKHFDLWGLLLLVVAGFGWAKPVPINSDNFKNRRKGMILVSAAGVTTNIVAAMLALLVFYLSYPVIGYYSPALDAVGIIYLKLFVYYLLVFFISINLMLAFFNLLPIYPLDGFRLVNEFLPRNNKFSLFMYKYGFYILIGVVISGYLFRTVGLWYLDIFGLVAKLINKLIFAVAG